MEQLTVFGPERFTLKPNRNEVFKWLQCDEQLPCYCTYTAAWDESVSLLQASIAPRAALVRAEDGAVSMFMTLGPEAETQITQLFCQERYVIASLLNTLCDEMLFQMDRQAGALLEEAFMSEGLHIATLMEPMLDLAPDDMLRRIQPMLRAFPFVRVSRQGTLFPTKSMMYSITLTHEDCRKHSLHDCSKCSQVNCLYRSVKNT